ncbi:predicted protein [Lichtheimia corymbifera JMRC:FSU:9682]|uniref:Uncharacterized protein n=1 Tax=Lichtheimia corymbifera JMRC:FSU:9682 TaxID=1263082 RepID=A0A068RUD0_9FUNG|nr:predicted protein [Lichtheimia corymbifera JMRC:FSU:9682]
MVHVRIRNLSWSGIKWHKHHIHLRYEWVLQLQYCTGNDKTVGCWTMSIVRPQIENQQKSCCVVGVYWQWKDGLFR